MKKFLLIIIILLLTTACSSSYFKNLKYNELEKKIKNKETFVLCIADESTASKTLQNTLLKVSKDNKLTTFYLNAEKLSNDQSKKLKELFTFEDANIIIFIKEGKETSTLSRITDTFISEADLANELAIQGYLKTAVDLDD